MRIEEGKKFIKLFPGEKVIEIQRQHWVVLVFPFMINIIMIVVLVLLIFMLSAQEIIFFPSIIFVYLALLFLSMLSVIGTYVFMDWYYKLYMITNKRFIKARFFRLGGEYLEEVFLNVNTGQEIVRTTPNFAFDLFDIDDVEVHFRSFERATPFIFEVPENPERIERILEKITVSRKVKGDM